MSLAPAASEDTPAVEAQSEPVVEAQPEPAAVVETPSADAPQEHLVAEATTETAAPGDAAPVEAGAAPETPATPELIEVWRPGGRSEERRPRHDRNRHRHQDRAKAAQEGAPQDGAAPVAASGEAADGARRERHGRGRRERNKDFRKPRTDAPAEAGAVAAPTEGAPVREDRRDDRGGRPPRERFQGKGKDGKGRDNRDGRDKGKFGGGRDKGGRDKGDRDNRSGGGPSHRQYASSAPPRERERPIDPNSPFAKLAALKEQLTANRKDR